jgi:hypothetical protein
MPTIFNPYQNHSWFYQGSTPTKSEYEIARDYLKSKFNKSLS